jgi:hypothetical protein
MATFWSTRAAAVEIGPANIRTAGCASPQLASTTLAVNIKITNTKNLI